MKKEYNGIMEKADDTVLVCTECGHSVEIDDYGYEDKYDDYYESIDDLEDMPFCCKACRGPYPSCQTSCKIFGD